MMSAFRLAAVAIGLIAFGFSTAADAQAIPPDLVYSRIKSCRVFDTSKTKKIPANSVKSFLISGDGDYAAQGGTAAGCGVPASAQAVSLNLTAINGAAAGSLTAAPYAQTTSVMTLRYPVSAPETAGGTVDLDRNKITLKTTNTVNAIGDVTGYYAPALWAYLYANAQIIRSSRLVSAETVTDGVYYLTFDRPLWRCSVQASPDGVSSGWFVRPYMSSGGQGDTVYVYVYDRNGAPIRSQFYVNVTC